MRSYLEKKVSSRTHRKFRWECGSKIKLYPPTFFFHIQSYLMDTFLWKTYRGSESGLKTITRWIPHWCPAQANNNFFSEELAAWRAMRVTHPMYTKQHFCLIQIFLFLIFPQENRNHSITSPISLLLFFILPFNVVIVIFENLQCAFLKKNPRKK